MRSLIAKLIGVKPGPGTHCEMRAGALAEHYASGGEKARLVELPIRAREESGYKVPVIKGRWPVMERVKMVQDHEDRNVVCIDIDDDSVKWATGWIFYLDPEDVMVIAPEVA